MAALMMPPLHRKEKVYRATVCHLTNLTDDELRARYRFGQDSINFIANLLREDLVRTTNKATVLTVEEQVKIALRFYASGSFLQVIGDTLGYNKGTVSRVVDNVTNALIARKDQFIKWPTDNHTQNKIRYGFFQQANFPNVLGCIDGTHVRIQRPSEDEGSYINRKSYPSINVQAVCDHEGNYFDYFTLFAAFYFSVLSVRTFVYVDYLPLIFSVCVNSTLYQFAPSTILFYLLKCKNVKLPHWSGTKDFFQKKDERKKHNLADNI